MKSIRLPFEIEVEMCMNNSKTFPLSIMKANVKDYDMWLCNKLINCVWLEENKLDSIEEDLWSTEGDILFRHGFCMVPKTFSMEGFDLIEFNKSMLNEGNYVTGQYNNFYIPNSSAYNNHNFDSQYIIFGYDDSRKIFHSARINESANYVYFDIKYDDYYNAVVNAISEKVELDFYRMESKYELTLNIKEIKTKLKDYCNNSKAIVDGNTYGIKAWEKFAEYVINCKQDLNINNSKCYMEHHLIMLKRIRYFQREGYIDNEMLVSKYEKIYLKTKMVHELVLKFNIEKNREILNDINNIIIELLPIEKNLINNFIESIES